MTVHIRRSRIHIILSAAAIGFSFIETSEAALDCRAVLTMSNQAPALGASSYGRRSEERCEGTIREDQAGSVGAVISLLELLPRGDLSSTSAVVIARSAEIPKGATATATIMERTARHYYRLDVALDKAKAVSWPLDEIAKPLGVTLSNVGVVGRIQDPTKPGQTIFFPVALRQPQLASASEQSDILLRMNLTAPARNVSVNVGHHDAQGNCIGDQELLSLTSSSPSTPLEVTLPAATSRAFCIRVFFSTKNLDGKFVEGSTDLSFQK